MYRKPLLSSLVILSALGLNNLFGQATFQFTIQSWGTYTTYDHYGLNADSTAMELKKTTTQMGFGIRRARLRGKMTKGNATGFVQYDAPTAKMTDAQVDYKLSDNLKLRMGRYVGAGSQAGGNTSHTAIDFAERTIVGRNWAAQVGRSDYRTYGLSLIGSYTIFNYQIMANNGDGNMNLKPYGTKSDNSSKDTGVLPQLDFAISTKLQNGLNFGGHFGLPNEKRINKSSITGFVYYVPMEYTPGKIRGKFDIAQISDYTGVSTISTLGYRVNGFYKLNPKMEIGAGYETWDPDIDADQDAYSNFLVGVNYSPTPEQWKDTLFKLVATFKTSQIENEPRDPMMIHLIWQVYMH